MKMKTGLSPSHFFTPPLLVEAPALAMSASGFISGPAGAVALSVLTRGGAVVEEEDAGAAAGAGVVTCSSAWTTAQMNTMMNAMASGCFISCYLSLSFKVI